MQATDADEQSTSAQTIDITPPPPKSLLSRLSDGVTTPSSEQRSRTRRKKNTAQLGDLDLDTDDIDKRFLDQQDSVIGMIGALVADNKRGVDAIVNISNHLCRPRRSPQKRRKTPTPRKSGHTADDDEDSNDDEF